jgi:hypothetical protein
MGSIHTNDQKYQTTAPLSKWSGTMMLYVSFPAVFAKPLYLKDHNVRVTVSLSANPTGDYWFRISPESL